MKPIHMLSVALGLFVATQAFAVAKDGLKVAVVDVQTIVDNTSEGKRAKDLLKKEREEKQAILEKKKSSLKTLEDNYNKKKLVWKGDVLQEKQRELQEKTLELQKLVFDWETQFRKKQDQLSQGIMKNVNAVIHKIGLERGFDFVLEKNSVFYFKPTYEITKDVIRLYDKTYK